MFRDDRVIFCYYWNCLYLGFGWGGDGFLEGFEGEEGAFEADGGEFDVEEVEDVVFAQVEDIVFAQVF